MVPLRHILLWVTKHDDNIIKPIQTKSCNNQDLVEALSDIILKCLWPTNTAQAFSWPIESLSTSMVTTQTLRCYTLSKSSNNSENISISFRKIPERYQGMLLLESCSVEYTPTKPNERASNLFQQSNVAFTQLFLNFLLEYKGVKMLVTTVMSTLLLYMIFLLTNEIQPSVIVSCDIFTKTVMWIYVLTEDLVLDFSKEKSAIFFDKLMKTQAAFLNHTI